MLNIPFLDNVIWKWFKPQTFDDPVDRLNYFLTATLLAFFAIMVSAKQYVGSPIQCWMPMEFKGGWEEYAEDYCFIQNTFFVPFHQEIPGDAKERGDAEIGYYQWVPIVLALQAVMFTVPNWLWKTLHKQSGVDLSIAVDDARKIRSFSGTNRKAEIAKLAAYLEECLEFQKDRRSPARFLCFRLGYGLGSFVSMLYLFIKFLYLANIAIQFYMLNKFLGGEYTLWGFQAFSDLWHGHESLESSMFPRVTLCDFNVRRLANLHRYTVQCVLMINMFNEKIYLFLWFWFFMVAVVTVINFVYCFVQIAYFREKTTRTWLSLNDYGTDNTDNYREDKLMVRFTHNALRPDGVLLLRFIEGHAGAIVAREIITKLYTDYLESTAYSNRGAAISKMSSPGIIDDGPHENLYHSEKMGGLLEPDYPSKNV